MNGWINNFDSDRWTAQVKKITKNCFTWVGFASAF